MNSLLEIPSWENCQNGVSGIFMPGWNEVSPCGFVEVKPRPLLGRDIMYKLTPLFLSISLSTSFLHAWWSACWPLFSLLWTPEKESHEQEHGSNKVDWFLEEEEVLLTEEDFTRGGANWGEGNPSGNLKEFENLSNTRGLESCELWVLSTFLNSLYLTSHCFG